MLDGARQLELSLSNEAVEQFATHARELLRWNRKFNLTAITDPVEVAVKHYLDCVAAIRFLPSASHLLDIGSGGGFPGIPLKIAIPQMAVTLIDASRKKVSFLNHIGRQLGLKRCNALQMRAEDLSERRPFPQTTAGGSKTSRLPDSYDLVVTRALVSLDSFLTLAVPVLAENGVLVAFKGRLSQKEIDFDPIRRKGLSVTIHRYELPYVRLQRSLVIFKRGAL